MDILIECKDSPNNEKQLTIHLTNPPFRGKKIRKAFTESLKTIKFCRLGSIGSNHRRGKYTLTATITHPFKFPVETLRKNFLTALNGHVFRTYNLEFETELSAKCFTQQLGCLLANHNIRILRINNKINIRYSCPQDQHTSIRKTIRETTNRVKDRANWCLYMYMPYKVALPNILKLIGWEGEYKLYEDFLTIFTDDEKEATRYISSYDNVFNQITKLKGPKNNDAFLFLSYIPNERIMTQYHGRLILSGNGVYVIHFNYTWILTNTSRACTPEVTDAIQLVLDKPEETQYAKSIIYKGEYTDLIKLCFFFQDYATVLSNDEFICRDYFQTPDEPNKLLDQFEREKNACSLIRYDDVFSKSDMQQIRSAVKHHLKNFQIWCVPYHTLTRDLMAIISNCGPATNRRISNTLEQFFAHEKAKFLSDNDAEKVEIFSQDSLADIPADKIKYIVKIDTQYYDAKKLREIILIEDDPLIPHNRRPMTVSDYTLIINSLT